MADTPPKRPPTQGRDPFVSDSARRSASKQEEIESLKRKRRRSRWDESSSGLRRERSRRDSFLMFLFFGLAIFVYAGAQVASPKLIVTLSQGEGVVYVDGMERGHTGEVIDDIPPGLRTVTVSLDDPLLTLYPITEQEVSISWGLVSAELHFKVSRAVEQTPESDAAYDTDP